MDEINESINIAKSIYSKPLKSQRKTFYTISANISEDLYLKFKGICLDKGLVINKIVTEFIKDFVLEHDMTASTKKKEQEFHNDIDIEQSKNITRLE